MLNRYSQNFLKSPALISRLINSKSDIKPADTVLDIGAGKGVITKELSAKAKKIIAFEIDSALSKTILNLNLRNVEVIQKDFLNIDLVKFGDHLKVFSNIPFFITADIVRKLFIENSCVDSAYIIMEKGAAWRFLGKPFKSNSLISVLINARYECKIIWKFLPDDFIPRPNAEIVLLSFIKKNNFISEFKTFKDFTAFVFNLRKNSIKNALYDFWRYENVKSVLKSKGIGIGEKVSELNIENWLSVFREFIKLPAEKRFVVSGAYDHLLRHQQKLNRNKIIDYNG